MKCKSFDCIYYDAGDFPDCLTHIKVNTTLTGEQEVHITENKHGWVWVIKTTPVNGLITIDVSGAESKFFNKYTRDYCLQVIGHEFEVDSVNYDGIVFHITRMEGDVDKEVTLV